MKKPIILLLTCTLISAVLYAQSVKKQTTEDTAKYRASDRLKTAGPKEGWKSKNNTKIDSVKIKKDTVATTRKIDSLKRRD